MSAEKPVWMVEVSEGSLLRSRGPVSSGIKGRLALEPSRLVFTPESPDEIPVAFPLRDVKRVGKTPGSPVVQVRMRRPHTPRVFWFYFVEPPRLGPAEDRRPVANLSPYKRGKTKLALWNDLRGDEVGEWVERIRGAQASAEP